ncbi:Protein T10C6.6 e [Aphelenchoides avenae]|nr:Protein T10C6.6 e [Aphelenchus avenae]
MADRDFYALYHASRKNLSGVKASISHDWLDNATDHKPLFPSEAEAKTFLGALDAIFMLCYAGGLVFWGWLGDRLDPKHVVVFGMIGSAVTLTMFGSLPYWTRFYSAPYYIIIYVLFGIVQACGWPNEVTIMANWFKSNRGFVMGLWASCQPVGNIIGALIISAVLPMGYEYTFIFNSALIAAGGIILCLCVDSSPRQQYLREDSELLRDAEGSGSLHEHLHRPITMLEALMLPNVLAYCMCNALLKLVNYAFFFWLPFYLTHQYSWKETEANQLSAWYDFGGILGSVAGGIVSDRIGHRSPVIMTMLLSSLLFLFLYAEAGASKLLNVLLMTILGVTISGPYNLIVGTICVDLGSQPALAGNEKAMSTVTGIIDGVGSAGSAFGQVLVPIVQNSLGWNYIFYMFLIMNALAASCLARRFLHDVMDLYTTYGGARRHRRSSEEPLESEPLLAQD